jgi:hypothetical protein
MVLQHKFRYMPFPRLERGQGKRELKKRKEITREILAAEISHTQIEHNNLDELRHDRAP